MCWEKYEQRRIAEEQERLRAEDERRVARELSERVHEPEPVAEEERERELVTT